MTDNEQFKNDAEELFSKITSFKKKYGFMSSGKNPKPIDMLESDLRVILKILRTDEENQNQNKRDTWC